MAPATSGVAKGNNGYFYLNFQTAAADFQMDNLSVKELYDPNATPIVTPSPTPTPAPTPTPDPNATAVPTLAPGPSM